MGAVGAVGAGGAGVGVPGFGLTAKSRFLQKFISIENQSQNVVILPPWPSRRRRVVLLPLPLQLRNIVRSCLRAGAGSSFFGALGLPCFVGERFRRRQLFNHCQSVLASGLVRGLLRSTVSPPLVPKPLIPNEVPKFGHHCGHQCADADSRQNLKNVFVNLLSLVISIDCQSQ